ncbi:hypothetical protein HY086_02590 [Candidatus Gottesmanbacteria bacterium]|nr:hypothetical protein [Candidatus Gottesmanbacteria bacterium]
MIRTQVYIPDDLYTELKLLANIRKVNFSSLIREGAEKVVSAKRPKKKKLLAHLIGALTYGPKDLSNHVNDIYK